MNKHSNDNLQDEIAELRERASQLLEPPPRTLEEACRHVEELVTQRFRAMIPFAADSIGISGKELSSRLRDIRVIWHPSVNGFCEVSNDGQSFEIEISYGLIDFLLKFASVFACRMGTVSGDNMVEEITAPFEAEKGDAPLFSLFIRSRE